MIIVWLNNHKVFVYQLLDVASVYGTRQGLLKANTDKYRHWRKMECCCPKIYRKFFDAKKNTYCIWKSRDENTGKRNGFSSMWAVCYTSWLKNYISKLIILYTIICVQNAKTTVIFKDTSFKTTEIFDKVQQCLLIYYLFIM